jgi:hypothetical protein
VAKKRKKIIRTPDDQASGAGNGGIVPPVEARFKPGESGNPAGRKSAGATIKEQFNWLAEQDLNEAEVRKIARDKSLPWTRRAAAERILRTLEAGDLADMEPALRGEKDLTTLRSEGVNTEIVKKIKVKTRVTPDGEEVIEREMELHDRAGTDIDRILDRTEGKPAQSVDHTTGGKPFTVKVLRGVSMDDI